MTATGFGPAIIEEPATTVVVPASGECTVDNVKNYILNRSNNDPSSVIPLPFHGVAFLQNICKEMRHVLDRTCQGT
jgi:hypothetical protein